ncbi:hypothetical protein L211DRAFT_842297 [Terfezia boudieri ATCC MYA-4762]|uniref:Uncharacterized protein n=1 Tax=Terfezia boudieri ATCC MYA-4762 TaxID=1051890 RepID=A0A3N4LEJ9_9PEZI|nr:hypothetical protein L211DRAFT_842297 [Terfezia boudieri ATCC MYA-4762]
MSLLSQQHKLIHPSSSPCTSADPRNKSTLRLQSGTIGNRVAVDLARELGRKNIENVIHTYHTGPVIFTPVGLLVNKILYLAILNLATRNGYSTVAMHDRQTAGTARCCVVCTRHQIHHRVRNPNLV